MHTSLPTHPGATAAADPTAAGPQVAAPAVAPPAAAAPAVAPPAAGAPAADPDPRRAIPRRPALIAGLALALMAVLGGFANLGVLDPLMVADDAVTTTANLADNLPLVRAAVVSYFVVATLDVIVAWALWRVFGGGLAVLAAALRTTYAAALLAATGSLAGVLRSLDSPAPDPDVVLAQVQQFTDTWSVGLGLFGVHLLVVGVLCWRARFGSRIVGALVLVAGAGYLIDTLSVFAGLPIEIGTVTFVGEVVLLVWLLVLSRRRRGA